MQIMKNIRDILAVSCGYVAAIIGAGFASGQEIVSFFVKYGKYSFLGIIISAAIFAVFSYVVLCTCTEKKIYSYNDFLTIFFKGRIRNTIEAVTLVFALISVCVMTACAGEMAYSVFGIRKIIGAAVFSLMCGSIFFMGSKKIMGINSILGAVIIFGIIFCCLYILRFREHQVFMNEFHIIASSISYAGYNLLTTGAVLANMSRNLKDGKEAALSSLASGVIMLILMGLIWITLIIYYGKINLGEIPMLTMALRQNNIMGVLYGFMLLFAVLTTGISNGFGVIDMLSDKVGKKFTALIVVIVGFCFSGAGFSGLINVAYRACGYVGMIFVFSVMYKFFKKSEKRSKRENN